MSLRITVARYENVFDDVPTDVVAFTSEEDALAWINDQADEPINLQMIAG